MPVAPGRMRNIWYPEGKAEYMTDTQLQELKDVVIERDPLFGMDQASEKDEPSAKVDVNLLSVRDPITTTTNYLADVSSAA